MLEKLGETELAALLIKALASAMNVDVIHWRNPKDWPGVFTPKRKTVLSGWA